MPNYWLLKSEPEVFSFEDLKNCKDQTTYWDGVRNYQARNYLRDSIKTGDKVLFYHSNSEPNTIMGTCTVVKGGYPDFTAFDPENIHFDPKSNKDNPAWYMVDIKFEKEFSKPLTLTEIRNSPKLKNMKLLQKGNRLSVMPVTKDEYEVIASLGNK